MRGGAGARFNTASRCGVEFPPPALHQHHRIVAYLDGLQAKVDRLKELQAATAADVDALLPSILDEAFKGQM